MEFDNLNGFLTEKGDKLFDLSNRSLKYGDGIFETMKLVKGQIMFWEDHYQRLKKGIDHLKLDETGKDQAFWEKELEKVFVKNYYKDAKIRLITYRNAPGLYTPMANRLGYVIEGMRYDKQNYDYEPKGISLGVFEGDRKAKSPLSNHKSTSAVLFVLASIYKKEQGLGDVVVLNTDGNVCESTSSNLFAVIDGKIHTPSLDEGCLDGVMRKQILKYFSQKDVVLEEGKLTIEDLESAQEIFLTNTISGVQGVSAFKGKTLALDTSKELQKYLDYLVSQLTPKNLF